MKERLRTVNIVDGGSMKRKYRQGVMEKRTPKEVANFLCKPIALDSVRGIARWFWYDEVPTFVSDPEWQFCGWTSTKRLNELPEGLIEYHGDWEGSLTLPDGWEEK